MEALERTGARGCEGFNALKLPVGYNCRGVLWLGPARAEAVWDSGASRNSIDKDDLRALLSNDRTSSVVTDVTDIEPLNCQGLSKETRIQVSQVAYLNTTFMEDSRGEGGPYTTSVGYCIVENSSEDILVGRPTLDSLGFVSDKHSIELRTVGIRFGTVLPEEAAAQRRTEKCPI